MAFTHLMHVHPYQPGATRRTGAPWSLVKGRPFISVARKTFADWSSSNVKTQSAPGIDVADFIGYWSKPETITRSVRVLFRVASRLERGTPVQSPTLSSQNRVARVLPEHSINCMPER